jgi:Coenzyme PQQ synthesis protein D (PqqD)
MQKEIEMAKQSLSHLALSDDGFLFDPTSGHTYTLNFVGTFILKKMIEEYSFDKIVAAMMKAYDVPKDVLCRDLEQFFHFLSEQGIMTLEDSGINRM